jgi:hypothetical protein
LLFRHNGDGTSTVLGVETGVAQTEDGLVQAGMGLTAADYNDGGFLDILITNFDVDVPDLYYYRGRGGVFNFRTFDAKLEFNLKKVSRSVSGGSGSQGTCRG